jgi:hypothetical protein
VLPFAANSIHNEEYNQEDCFILHSLLVLYYFYSLKQPRKHQLAKASISRHQRSPKYYQSGTSSRFIQRDAILRFDHFVSITGIVIRSVSRGRWNLSSHQDWSKRTNDTHTHCHAVTISDRISASTLLSPYQSKTTINVHSITLDRKRVEWSCTRTAGTGSRLEFHLKHIN